MLFAFVCLVFHGAVPIPYVQVVILNLSHPYLRSTTVLLDQKSVPPPTYPPVLRKLLSCLRSALTVGCHASHAQEKQGSPIPIQGGNEGDAPPISSATSTGRLSCAWRSGRGPVPATRNPSGDKACGTTCKTPKVNSHCMSLAHTHNQQEKLTQGSLVYVEAYKSLLQDHQLSSFACQPPWHQK